MIQVSSPAMLGRAEAVRVRRRVALNTTSFWLLFVAEAALVIGVLLLVMRALPSQAPLTATPDYSSVREAIYSRVNGTTLDPMIEVQPGVVAPASNVRGLELHGTTYYYYFEGQQNFDPVSRSRIGRERTQVVLRDDGGPHPLVIYTFIQ